MSGSDRRRFTISLTAEEADVLDVLAYLNGYGNRAGAWVGDEVRKLVARRAGDDDIRKLLRAREQYRAARGRQTKHGFGVIDGGGLGV